MGGWRRSRRAHLHLKRSCKDSVMAMDSIAAEELIDHHLLKEEPVYEVTKEDPDALIQWKKDRTLPQQYAIQLGPQICSMEVVSEELSREELDALKGKIPKEYHRFLDVFNKKKASILPPNRSYDHQIKLQQGAAMRNCPSYTMSHDRLEKVKEYIDDMLAKGFIEPSSAPYASPILFVEKPGGGLRFCVDYRKLNALTEKKRLSFTVDKRDLSRVLELTDVHQRN